MRPSVKALAVAVILVGACTQDVVLFDTTAPPPGGGGGGVARVSLTLTLVVEAADSSVANALGWPGGWVPGADVSVRRTTAPVATFSATTDTLGTVRFDSLLTGNYEISALRALTVAEASQLTPPDGDVDALAAGGALTLGDSGAVRTVGAFASRRGSLVISEHWFPSRVSTTGDFYPYAGYLEVYNNSDTTILLDGKLVGTTEVQSHDTPNFPCSRYETWSNDSVGIWAQFIYQFPGSGGDYPLGPGQSVLVLATDAIDHRTVGPEAEDLSAASFEFEEGPDNPSVPNLVNVGTRTSFAGNGVVFYGSEFPFVADRVRVDTLLLELLPDRVYPHRRIPAAAVLDVAAFTSVGAPYPVCPHLVHRRFLRQSATLVTGTDTRPESFQRVVFRRLPSGRPILLRTLVTGRDFVRVAPRTPGHIP